MCGGTSRRTFSFGGMVTMSRIRRPLLVPSLVRRGTNAALISITVLAAVVLSGAHSANGAARARNGIIQPTFQQVQSNIGPGSARSFTVTVSVASIPAEGGYVQTNTTNDSLM